MLTNFLKRPFTFDRVARILFILLIVGVVIWVLNAIGPVLVPFLLAWLCAYLLMPVVHFFERKLKIKSRSLSVTLVLLLLLGVLVGVIAILVPSITAEVKKAWELFQYYDIGSVIYSLLPPDLQSRSAIFERLGDILSSVNVQEIIDGITQVLQGGWGILSSTFNYVMGLGVVFIFILYLIFILIDYEKLSKGVITLFPAEIRPFVKEAIQNIEYYVNTYFRGQVLIAFICGVLMSVGFYIIGLPMGISLGLFIGLLNLIPYLQLLGYIPLTVLALLHSAATGQNFFFVLLISAGVILLTDVVQDLFLKPAIHGQSMGIRPSIILLSLTVWGALFGILGMFFALPLTMILYSAYMKFVVGEPLEVGKMVQRADKPRWPFSVIEKWKKKRNKD